MNRWNSWLQNGTGSQHVAAILFTKQRLLCSVGFVRVGMKNAHTLDKPIQRTHWTNVLFLYTSLASGRAGKRAHGYHKHSIVMLMKTCENLWHLRTRWAGHSQSRTSEHQKRMDQQQKKPSQEPAVLAKSREGQKSCERIWRWKPCIFKGFFARACVFCCVCCAMLCSSFSPSLQGQTVGLLTQRLADARSAIAAELQDAATERAPSKVRRISKNHKTS